MSGILSPQADAISAAISLRGRPHIGLLTGITFRRKELTEGALVSLSNPKHDTMARRLTVVDKDRVEGSAKQAKGKLKEVAGKTTGDKKLESEGWAEKMKGKVQNTLGGIRDAVKGK